MEMLKTYVATKNFTVRNYFGEVVQTYNRGDIIKLDSFQEKQYRGFIKLYVEDTQADEDMKDCPKFKTLSELESFLQSETNKSSKKLEGLWKEEFDRLFEETNNDTSKKEENLLESIVDYNKNYNIHEVFTLLDNMPEGTEVINNSNNLKYKLSEYKDDLLEIKTSRHISNIYSLRWNIGTTFKLVKSKEENWIPCTFNEAFTKKSTNIDTKLKFMGKLVNIDEQEKFRPLHTMLDLVELNGSVNMDKWEYLEK